MRWLMIGVVLVAIAMVAWLAFPKQDAGTPAGESKAIYDGPMFNFRNGKWADSSRRVVPPPDGATTPQVTPPQNRASE